MLQGTIQFNVGQSILKCFPGSFPQYSANLNYYNAETEIIEQSNDSNYTST